VKKSLILSLVMVFVVTIAGNALAASNLADVPATHWAYASVNKLAKAGIIDGLGNGTFNGDKAITRYEMAVIVAKAMDNYNKADDANKAEIMKLVAEFGQELNKMGLRLTALEKNQQQSPISFGGSADVRYTVKNYEKDGVGASVNGQYRLRLNVEDKLDEFSTIGFRVVSQVGRSGSNYPYSSTWTKFGNTEGQTSDSTNTIGLDRVYVSTKFGGIKTTVGAQEIKFGATDAVIDSGSYSFSGVRAEGKAGAFNLASNVGRFELTGKTNKVDVVSIEASTKTGNFGYGLGYMTFKDKLGSDYATYYADETFGKYIMANVSYNAAPKLSFGAEYVKNQADIAAGATSGGKDAEIVYAVYGDQKLAKRGDSNWKVSYYKAGKYALTRWTGWDLIDDGKSTLGTAATSALDTKDTKGYNIKYTYALGKKLSGYLMYEKITDDQATSSSDGGYNFYRIGLSAKI